MFTDIGNRAINVLETSTCGLRLSAGFRLLIVFLVASTATRASLRLQITTWTPSTQSLSSPSKHDAPNGLRHRPLGLPSRYTPLPPLLFKTTSTNAFLLHSRRPNLHLHGPPLLDLLHQSRFHLTQPLPPQRPYPRLLWASPSLFIPHLWLYTFPSTRRLSWRR